MVIPSACIGTWVKEASGEEKTLRLTCMANIPIPFLMFTIPMHIHNRTEPRVNSTQLD